MSKALPKRDYAKNTKGPLAGVRVLDLSRLVAGNTVTDRKSTRLNSSHT